MLWVGLGGGVGSILRFLVASLGTKVGFTSVPATFFVNIAGCFLVGLLAGATARHHGMHDTLQLLLMSGFCGGFTTFSAFSMESLRVLQAGDYFFWVLYLGATVVMTLAATWLGFFIAK
jgi:CrcB protein